MKYTLFLLLMTSVAFSQISKESIERENPKNIYIDKKGKIYSPKQNIHIGFSLDKDNFYTQEKEIISNGKHSLDLSSQKMIGESFSFFVDSIPPKIELFKNNQKIKNKLSTKASRFSLNTLDNDSGVKKSYYQINDLDPIEFKDTITFSIAERGKHTVEIFSIDNVGNIAHTIKNISIDPTPPSSVINFSNSSILENGKTVVGNQSFATITSEDEFSKIKTIFYKISRDEFQYYSKPINLYPLKEGEYKAQFYGEDIVGNREEIQNKEFFFDGTPPTTQLEFQGFTNIINKKFYVSGETEILLSASDLTGIKDSYIQVNKEKPLVYKEPLFIKDLSNTTEKLKITYNSIDSVENIENIQTKVVYLDNRGPSISIKVSGAHSKNDNKIFLGSNGTIKVFAKDNETSVKDLFFKINNEEPQEYVKPIETPDLENFTLTIIATDSVENITENVYQVSVDKTLPTIEHYFSYQGLKAVEIGEVGSKTYYKNTTIYIKAEDKDSGIAKVLFQINEGRELEYIKPLTFKKSGLYNMRITVIDKLGNKTIRKDVIEIKDKK